MSVAIYLMCRAAFNMIGAPGSKQKWGSSKLEKTHVQSFLCWGPKSNAVDP